jgi:hypothetical protein
MEFWAGGMYGVDVRRIYCGHQGRSDPLIPSLPDRRKREKKKAVYHGVNRK